MKNKLQEILSFYPEMKGIHPAASLFPFPLEDEFNELVAGVKEFGLLEPIKYQADTHLLIDGRSRLMACYEAQVEPRWQKVTADPWVVSMQSGIRRNLTTGQKAMVGVKLKEHYAVEAKERMQKGRPKEGKAILPEVKKCQARDKAAQSVGVGAKSIDKAVMITENAPDLAEKVTSAEITLEQAARETKQRMQAKPQPKEQRATPAITTKIITFDNESMEINKPNKPVFNKTNDNVDWAGYTWNPVTGCLHGCKFCYAEEIANMQRMKPYYPFGFKPTFHEYRLASPKNTKPDGRVFVCSMADLFGKWVPDEWIKKVFNACMSAPEWEYLFLTKWPNRYKMLEKLPLAWFGASIIKQSDVARVEREMQSFNTDCIKWISLEPMLEPIKFNDLSWCDLVVIGSQTAANGHPAFAPDFDWVVDVVNQCREAGIKYYLKPNLMELKPGMKVPRNLPTVK